MIRVKNPFKDAEEKLITAIEQHWNEYGNVPTGEKLVRIGAVDNLEQYTNLMETEFVRKALIVLGIRTDPDLQILTPLQLAAVQVMFDFHDGRSDNKKLKDLGISGQQWQNWLQDPSFQDYLNKKSGNLFKNNLHEADKALLAKVRSGNVEAIRMFNAINGRFQEVEVPKIGQIEAHLFVMRLFEVLQQHLIDQPERLRQIGQAIMEIQSPYMSHPKVIEAVPID